MAAYSATTPGSVLVAEAIAAIPLGMSPVIGDVAEALSIAVQHLLSEGGDALSQQEQLFLQGLVSATRNLSRLFRTSFAPRSEYFYDNNGALIDLSRNSFAPLVANVGPAIECSVECAGALLALSRSDPALSPISPADVESLLRAISSGILLRKGRSF